VLSTQIAGRELWNNSLRLAEAPANPMPIVSVATALPKAITG
jgi:hypothetical protein